MPEIKHTPEPWRVEHSDISGWYQIYAGNPPEIIISCEQGNDAKLIAAAPRMYRTLQKIAQMNICDSAFLAPNAAKKVIEEVEGE